MLFNNLWFAVCCVQSGPVHDDESSWESSLHLLSSCAIKLPNTGNSTALRCSNAGTWFNIKMRSYQYRKSYCGNKMVLRSCYLHNRIYYTGKTSFYLELEPLVSMTSLWWRKADLHTNNTITDRITHFTIHYIYGSAQDCSISDANAQGIQHFFLLSKYDIAMSHTIPKQL